LGVPTDGLRMNDGSGLSLLDRVEPVTLARLLDLILTSHGDTWEVLRASLPVAGRPGTLETRMTERPVGGNLRGKTGFVPGVRNMAGWVTSADGVPVVYVAM